jgi:hypothetical protein
MSSAPDLKSIFAKVKELASQAQPGKSPRTEAAAPPSSKRSKAQDSQEEDTKRPSSSRAGGDAADGGSKPVKTLAPAPVHRDRVRLVNCVEAILDGDCVVYCPSSSYTDNL